LQKLIFQDLGGCPRIGIFFKLRHFEKIAIFGQPSRKIIDQLRKYRRQHRLDGLLIRKMIEEERH